MTTPAKRHKMRVLAELAAKAAGPGDEVRGSAYELMLAQLAEHKRTLKTIQSTERKIEAKRKMLPDFEDYVTGALEGGQGAHDMVLTTVLVWHLDAGNWARGLEIAAYALAHGLVLPDQYNRTLPTLLIDETATAAAKGQLVGDEALRVLAEVDQLTADKDAPDQARAKLYKAIGYALIGKTPTSEPDFTTLDETKARLAMEKLQRAHELFAQVGVKKDMERLERRLKAADTGTD